MGSGNLFGNAIKFIDPVGFVINKVHENTGLKDIGFLNDLKDMYQQPFNNVINVLEGREQFGTHANWFGTPDEKRIEDANIANNQLWEDYYSSQGTYTYTPSQTISQIAPQTVDLQSGYNPDPEARKTKKNKPKSKPKSTAGTSLLNLEDEYKGKE